MSVKRNIFSSTSVSIIHFIAYRETIQRSSRIEERVSQRYRLHFLPLILLTYMHLAVIFPRFVWAGEKRVAVLDFIGEDIDSQIILRLSDQVRHSTLE